MNAVPPALPPEVERRIAVGRVDYLLPTIQEENAKNGQAEYPANQALRWLPACAVAAGIIGWLTGFWIPLFPVGFYTLAALAARVEITRRRTITLSPGWIGYHSGYPLVATGWRRLPGLVRIEARCHDIDPWEPGLEPTWPLALVFDGGYEIVTGWFGDLQPLHIFATHLSAEIPRFGGEDVCLAGFTSEGPRTG